MSINFILFEDSGWKNFIPLSYSRPCWGLMPAPSSIIENVLTLINNTVATRIGFWCRKEIALKSERSVQQLQNLKHEVSFNKNLILWKNDLTVLLNGRGIWKSLPSKMLMSGPFVGIVKSKNNNNPHCCNHEETIACIVADKSLYEKLSPKSLLNYKGIDHSLDKIPKVDLSKHVDLLEWPWDLLTTSTRLLQSKSFSETKIDETAVVHKSVDIDTSKGGVIISKGSVIHPFSVIQGPTYIGPYSEILPHSLIKENTIIGSVCKIAGEVQASIFFDYSNKQHVGFIGNSIIGSWVNIGAGTTISNLKSTYGFIKLQVGNKLINSGQQFLGAIIGDHAKLSVNTKIIAGTSIGFFSTVDCCICPKFVPSLSWFAEGKNETYKLDKAITVAKRMMKRRNINFTDEDLFNNICLTASELETILPN